jgi:hypothetical protein
MKFDEVETTLKHSETINGNVKSLSERIKRKDKGNGSNPFQEKFNLACWWGRVPARSS